MSDITINYKGDSIATMDASGTKTLLTEGKYCEDDIEIVYVKPSDGSSIVEVNTMVMVSEMNSYNALVTMGVKLKYKKSFVMMTIVGDTAATGGINYTNNNYFLIHDGTTVTSKSAQAWLQQTSNRIAPSTMAGQINNTSYGWYQSADVNINSDGTFTFRSSASNVMIPAGATVIVTEIPTQYANGSIDLTLFGD